MNSSKVGLTALVHHVGPPIFCDIFCQQDKTELCVMNLMSFLFLLSLSCLPMDILFLSLKRSFIMFHTLCIEKKKNNFGFFLGLENNYFSSGHCFFFTLHVYNPRSHSVLFIVQKK